MSGRTDLRDHGLSPETRLRRRVLFKILSSIDYTYPRLWLLSHLEQHPMGHGLQIALIR